MLFTLELQRRIGRSGRSVVAVTAHPGVAQTNLISHVGGIRGNLNKLALRAVTQDVEHGALPTLNAAGADMPKAGYVGPDGFLNTKGYPKVANPSKAGRDPDLANRLGDVSGHLTGIDTGTGATLPAAA